MPRKTCHGCPHLKSTKVCTTPFYSCGETGMMVPHCATTHGATFYRVPLDCPLPESEVEKSAAKQPPSEWAELTHD